MNTYTHIEKLTKTKEFDYELPFDAIAVVHYESNYDGDIFGGAVKEMNGKLYRFDGVWIETIFTSLDNFKKRYGKDYVVWENTINQNLPKKIIFKKSWGMIGCKQFSADTAYEDMVHWLESNHDYLEFKIL